MAESWLAWRDEIFAAGHRGALPRVPAHPDRLAELAEQHLPAELWSFISGGAGSGRTILANRAAFDRWEIVPRMLSATGQPTMRTELLATGMSAPVALAPIGLAGLAHPDREAGAARAAAALGLPMMLSNSSSQSLEEVADQSEGADLWFQLHPPKVDALGIAMAQRAEKAGYRAVVVTVDSWTRGWRPRDVDNAYDPFLGGHGMGTFLAEPLFRQGLPTDVPEHSPAWLRSAAAEWRRVFGHPGLTFDYFDQLRDSIDLPILIKGVLHPDDAERALAHGLDGIVVSNHGGRQIDRARAALDALPGVVERVAGQVPVLFDSGVRSGADVAIALGLGADAVLIGRPWIYGLAIDGEQGVRHVLCSILAELELTMLMAGVGSVDDLSTVVAPVAGSRL